MNPPNPPLHNVPALPNIFDILTQLSRRMQAQLVYDPPRRVGGVDHRPLFQASVQLLPHGYSATGSGFSKISARRAAAGAMIELLKTHQIHPSRHPPPASKTNSTKQHQVPSLPSSQLEPLFFVDREPDPALEREVNASAKAHVENATASIQKVEPLAKVNAFPRRSPLSVTQSAPSSPQANTEREHLAQESQNVQTMRGPSVSDAESLPPVMRRPLPKPSKQTVAEPSLTQSASTQMENGVERDSIPSVNTREALVAGESVNCKPWQNIGGKSPFMPTKPRVLVGLSKPVQAIMAQTAEETKAMPLVESGKKSGEKVSKPTVVDAQKVVAMASTEAFQKGDGNSPVVAKEYTVGAQATKVPSSLPIHNPKMVTPRITMKELHEGKRELPPLVQSQLSAAVQELQTDMQMKNAIEEKQNETREPVKTLAPGPAKDGAVNNIEVAEGDVRELERISGGAPIAKSMSGDEPKPKEELETKSLMGQMRVTISQLISHPAPRAEEWNTPTLIRSPRPPRKWRADTRSDENNKTEATMMKRQRPMSPVQHGGEAEAQATLGVGAVPLRKRARPITEDKIEQLEEEFPCRLRLTVMGDLTIPWVRKQIQKLTDANLFVELWLVVGGSTEASGECVKGVSRIAVSGVSMAIALAFEAGKRWERLWVDRARYLADGGIPALSPRIIIVSDDPMLSFMKQQGVVDIVNSTDNELTEFVQTLLEAARRGLSRS